MFKKIAGLISGKDNKVSKKELPDITFDKNGQPVSEDLMIAICAILINLASSDDEIAKEEAETICSLLDFNLHLTEEQIPQIVEKAVVRRREILKLEDYTVMLNNFYSIEQRLRILAMAWKLILADNKVEKVEEKSLIKLSTMLYLSLSHQEEARVFAEEGKV